MSKKMCNFVPEIKMITIMKNKIFTLLFALFVGTCSLFANPIKIGELYYRDSVKTTFIPPMTFIREHLLDVVASPEEDKYSGDIVIPANVEIEGEAGYVRSIEVDAFAGCTGLTSITIGSNVAYIGEGAFSGCTALTSVIINSDYIVNKSYNFSHSFKDIFGDQVTQYVIGDGVTGIGNSAFSNCTALTSVTIGNSVTSIGKSAFEGCTSLTSINIPNSVTSVGDYAFSECNSLPVIDNIRYADTYLVKAADKSLSSCTIQEGTRWIGSYAFYQCSNLTSIEIPNTVERIEYSAFSDCSGLTSLVIPNGVTSIGAFAFSMCSGLSAIEIPNSVTSIGDYAFAGCSGVTSIEIPNSVTSIGEWAFSGVNNIVYSGSATGSPWGAKSVNGYVEEYFVYSDDTRTTLLGCSSLASGEIAIPNSVTTIGKQAFSMCTALTAVEIPESVTSIGDYAFNYCIGLASVTLPNSLISIGNGVFSQCHALTSIEIPNSVTSIGSGVFTECLALSTVTIGSGVTSIGSYAFSMCSGLTSVTCLATTPPALDEAVFYDVDCAQIPLYVPQESVEAYKAADQWKDFTNIRGIGDSGETKEKSVNVQYLNPDEEELHAESVTFHVPVAPEIEGFTFVKWTAESDDIEEGIILRAVYKANEQSAPAVVVNPSNPAQKLIRNGSVYILRDDKTYTVHGQEIR